MEEASSAVEVTIPPKKWAFKEWSYDQKDFKGRFLRAPLMHDVPYPVTMEPNLVIEYYSR